MTEQEFAEKSSAYGRISSKQKISLFWGMTSLALQIQQKSGAQSSLPLSPSAAKPGVEKLHTPGSCVPVSWKAEVECVFLLPSSQEGNKYSWHSLLELVCLPVTDTSSFASSSFAIPALQLPALFRNCLLKRKKKSLLL